MTRYNLIKNNDNIIFQFVKNGILSYMILRDIEIYNEYKKLELNITKEMKYLILAEMFELSNDRIKQIIYCMESEIK